MHENFLQKLNYIKVEDLQDGFQIKDLQIINPFNTKIKKVIWV